MIRSKQAGTGGLTIVAIMAGIGLIYWVFLAIMDNIHDEHKAKRDATRKLISSYERGPRVPHEVKESGRYQINY